MSTWEQLSKVPWNKVSIFTWEQLGRLTPDELLALANNKVEVLSHTDPKRSDIFKAMIGTIALNIGSDAAYDALASVDWITILKQLIQLLQAFTD